MAQPSLKTPAEPDDFGDWAFYRQGDDGNPVIVQQGLSEAFANSQVIVMQQRGHHQTYWASIPTPNDLALK